MKYIAIGAATIALAVSPALAQGKGNGNGNGNAPDQSAKAQGKPDKGPRGGDQARGNGNGNGNAKADRGTVRAESRERIRSSDRVMERGNGNGDSRANRSNAAEVRGNGNGNGNRVTRQSYDRAEQDRYADRYSVRFDERTGIRFGDSRDASFMDGCPPGLAKKYNGCNPPGQVRNQRSPYGTNYLPALFGLGGYEAGRYLYDDGYLLRYNGGDISGYIPLLGGALTVGNPWPQDYYSARVPDYYVDYYNLGGPQDYRYADNVLYRVDPQSAAIQSIAALLTGNDFTIGQPMPRGYDVYNVPYGYRDQYYDSPEASYRYSDGYVYQVDPTTQLITAAIDLLI